MPFNASKDTEDDDLIEIQERIIQDIADNMGAMENIVVDNDLMKEGSLVCKSEYMSPGRSGSLWYLIPKEGTISTVVDIGK
eukprot:14903337-Ditylum_brightwellii.AAC.1